MRWRFFLRNPLVQRRTVWWPTWIGWGLIAAGLAVPVVWWALAGESFLSLTERLQAEVLVVEGWIGRDGMRAAATEFERGGYQYVVTSGGPASGRWEKNPLTYAEMADRELIRSGVPKERIIVAPSKSTESRRTYESAVAVFHALQARIIRAQVVQYIHFWSSRQAQPFGFRQG